MARDGNDEYVFVCYAHQDSAVVISDMARLRASGFSIRYDEGNSPEAKWSNTLARHIEGCSWFLYFVSPASVGSEHCRRELGLAQLEHRPVLCVELKPVEKMADEGLRLHDHPTIRRYQLREGEYLNKLIASMGMPALSRLTAPFNVGDGLVDPARGTIAVGEGEVHIEPKVMEVLCLLASHPGDVLSRRSVVDAVWSDTYGGDESLSRAISILRRTLGDAQCIETVPKRGYRLTLDVTPTADARASEPIEAVAETAQSRDKHEDKIARQVASVDPLAGEEEQIPRSNALPAAPTLRRKFALPLSSAVIAVVVLVGGGIAWFALMHRGPREQPTAALERFEIRLPTGLGLTNRVGYPLFITPDGGTIVFNATDAAGTRYYTRSIGQLGVHPIEGVGAGGSLWRGPNSRWFIYNDAYSRVYRKERITGGPPVQLLDGSLTSGGVLGLDWAPNGDIVFANMASGGLVLLKGGASVPTPLTQASEDMIVESPRFVPGGRAIVYDEATNNGPLPRSGPKIMLFNLETGARRKLVDGSQPRVTKSGHLLYIAENILWATAFDTERLEVYGKPEPVMEGVARTALSMYDVADNGTLVYVPADAERNFKTDVVWLSTDGSAEDVPLARPFLDEPDVSPDASRVAVISYKDITQELNEVWVLSFDGKTASRLTFDGLINASPKWSPDGTQIVYTAGRFGIGAGLMVRAADGTGSARRLTKAVHARDPSFTPDGRAVIFATCMDKCDIARVSIDGHAPMTVLAKTSSNDIVPSVSPNGRWLAYESDENGRSDVFVRPYPDVGGGRWQVSTHGGEVPRWSPDGSQLYYVEPDSNSFMSVSIASGKTFSAGSPEPVLNLTGYRWRKPAGGPNFTTSRDGKRLFLLRSPRPNRIIVVLNWLDEVKRLVPTEHMR